MPDTPTHPDDRGGDGAASKEARLTIPYRPTGSRPARGGRVAGRVRRWARNSFSSDQLGNALRSLLWVGPLTILIWIYAEREQIQSVSLTIPISVVSKDPSRVVMPGEGVKPQVMATLSGPKAKLDLVRERLEDQVNNPPLRIEVGSALGLGEQRIPTSRLADSPLLVSNGVTLSGVPQPESIPVRIDRIAERQAQVEPDEGLEGTTVFDPPTVTVRGPETLLQEAEGRGNLKVRASLKDRVELQSDQPKIEVKNVHLTPAFGVGAVAIAGDPTVNAVVELARSETYVIPAVRVWAGVPTSLMGRYTVKFQDGDTIPQVKVIGPKDEIETLKRPPVPVAFLVIDETTPGTAAKGPLKYVDLPPHVKLAPGAPQEWGYTLTKAEGP